MFMRQWRGGFTLLELLVVVGIVVLLAGLILPALSRGREQSRSVVCLAHLGEMGKGLGIYFSENEDNFPPMRMFGKPGGTANPGNFYDVGNGLKYRPRWPALIGAAIKLYAFNHPEPPAGMPGASTNPVYDRQDYEHDVFQCPEEPTWVDERNFAYGYNYQFLGNSRQTNDTFHHFPVKRHRVTAPGGTVFVADSMGTAAGFGLYERTGYQNDGTSETALANHGHTLDPPRLTDKADRGTGDPGSPRTAVDPRHRDRANAVFVDGHGESKTERELGYRTRPNGRYVDVDPNDASGDSGPGGATGSAWEPGWGAGEGYASFQQNPQNIPDAATNVFFSGSGRDDDPPPVPGR